MPERKVQRALGRNARELHPSVVNSTTSFESAGQVVLDSVAQYLKWGHDHDDGTGLTDSIHSLHLRRSANFSARAARTAYLLGKVALLRKEDRKAVVRTQIIEYGAVAEAILLDLVQSVGIHDRPVGLRTASDESGLPIDWRRKGLFSLKAGSSTRQKHRFSFAWLTRECERLNAIDASLRVRVNWLRESRNLVHPVIPTPQRYNDDLNSARSARRIAADLRDAAKGFKATHGLP